MIGQRTFLVCSSRHVTALALRLATFIFVMAIAATGCRRRDPAVEFLRQCRSMNQIAFALSESSGAGKPLPSSQAELSEWVSESPTIRDGGRQALAEPFFRRGLYLTSFTDRNGRCHDQILLMYVVVYDQPFVSAAASTWSWSEFDLPENKARAMYGDDIVDQLVERSKKQ
jgi:hypothetical protein